MGKQEAGSRKQEARLRSLGKLESVSLSKIYRDLESARGFDVLQCLQCFLLTRKVLVPLDDAKSTSCRYFLGYYPDGAV